MPTTKKNIAIYFRDFSNSNLYKKILGNHLTQAFLATATIFLLFLGTFGMAEIKDFKNTKIDNYIRQKSQEWTFYERLLLSAIPVLLYLIFSGKISSFKAGSFEIQLTQAYQEPVFYKDVEIEYIPVEVMEKQDLRQLLKIMQRISASQDKIPVLTIEIDKKNYYKRYILEEYLETLIKYASIKYVVFVKNKVFQGYIDAQQLLYNLKGLTVKREEDKDIVFEEPDLGQLIIQYIEEGNLKKIQGASERYIDKYFSNKQALTKMEEWQTSQLAVVDDQDILVGFTNKEIIATSILNHLVK